MPATTVELLRKISDELSFAALEWKVFEALFFESNPDTIHNSAPGFFEVVRYALQRDILLALARLTDPATMGKFENLSLQALVEALPTDADAERVAEIRAKLASLHDEVAPLRAWRMKYLAHNDLDHSLGRQELQPSSRVGYRNAFTSAAAIVERVAELVSPGYVPVPLEVFHNGGARRLLRLLKKGLVGDDGYMERE